MKCSADTSVADSFSSLTDEEGTGLSLENGSRIAVVGGGPSGSFFAFFLLKMAAAIDLDIEVDIYDPRSFSHCGPAGCNHCGGIVSESLVQILAAEGINLPASVVQRGIESYVVHLDVGSVAIQNRAGEQRIAALYRGNGPREGGESPWESFDGYLQGLAVERGARVVHRLITDIDWRSGYPWLQFADQPELKYDLVAVATGVNSNFLKMLDDMPTGFKLPRTTRAFVCEFRSSEEEILRILGNSVHAFLLPIPRLEFAAIIPKGEFATVVMLGDDLDEEVVHAFLRHPAVLDCFPTDALPCVCSCAPLVNMGARKKPFGDRIVLVGDSGVTRLYKDGIGAAFRTGKAAATAAVFQGVSEAAFRRGFWPTCRSITNDNAIGKVMFGTTTILKRLTFLRNVILRMTAREQMDPSKRAHMSSLLWNMFTGSAPYTEIFLGAIHPGFIGNFALNFIANAWPDGPRKKVT
jgi:flavin-dependent dehydrogenase